MKIYRCKEELRLPVMGKDGRPIEGRQHTIPVGTVFTGEAEPEAKAWLVSLWGDHRIWISQQTLERHFEELA